MVHNSINNGFIQFDMLNVENVHNTKNVLILVSCEISS